MSWAKKILPDLYAFNYLKYKYVMRPSYKMNTNSNGFSPSTICYFDLSLIVFNDRDNSATENVDEDKSKKDSPREHLPEDDDPNKKTQPVRDPDDKDKDKAEKEDYTSEGNKRYVKQPTRQADDPYLPGEEDDLVEDE